MPEPGFRIVNFATLGRLHGQDRQIVRSPDLSSDASSVADSSSTTEHQIPYQFYPTDPSSTPYTLPPTISPATPPKTWNKKNYTCRHWWLRTCQHTSADCPYAHRLFAGRASKHVNLSCPCARYALGTCIWPARLCYHSHGAASVSNALVGAGEATHVFGRGVVCKHCDTFFSEAWDLKDHLHRDGKWRCGVLKELGL